MNMLSRIMIVLGVVGVALRVDGHLEGEPWWLFKLFHIGMMVVLLFGLKLFGLALKREILEEIRKKNDRAA